MNRRDFSLFLPLLLAGCGGDMEYQIQPSPSLRTNKNVFNTGVVGNFTPTLTAATPGNLSITYSIQEGRYQTFGEFVLVTFAVYTSGFTHTTAASNLILAGLPFNSESSGVSQTIGTLIFTGINKANYTVIGLLPNAGTNQLMFRASGMGQALAFIDITDCPSGGTVQLQGTTWYRTEKH